MDYILLAILMSPANLQCKINDCVISYFTIQFLHIPKVCQGVLKPPYVDIYMYFFLQLKGVLVLMMVQFCCLILQLPFMIIQHVAFTNVW